MDKNLDLLKQIATNMAEQSAVEALVKSNMDDNLKSFVAALITHSSTTVQLDKNKNLTIDLSDVKHPGVMFNFKCQL